jgi:hypothetical protein
MRVRFGHGLERKLGVAKRFAGVDGLARTRKQGFDLRIAWWFLCPGRKSDAPALNAR